MMEGTRLLKELLHAHEGIYEESINVVLIPNTKV